MRSRITESTAENQRTARITNPCSQFLGKPPVSMNCQIVTTASPVAAITRIPGHQAQKPAKKPQKGPRAFCVHTESEPSLGNMSPSCAVTSAPGIRKARKPRIQNVYADGPARWIADAFTMNRTIATKMIVMSAEFRTRGSMPGAMRSEIIWRSSAGATAAIHHLRVGCAGIFALEAGFDQEPGEERGAHGDRVEEDVLVARVRSGPLRAEPVEHRDAERADEVAVRAAAGGALVEVEPEPFAVLARLLEEPRRAGRALERRPREAALKLEPRAEEERDQAREHPLDLWHVPRVRDADVDPGLRVVGDDVLAQAAADDSDVDGDAVPRVVQASEDEDLVRELLDGAHALVGMGAPMRRTAARDEPV